MGNPIRNQWLRTVVFASLVGAIPFAETTLSAPVFEGAEVLEFESVSYTYPLLLLRSERRRSWENRSGHETVSGRGSTLPVLRDTRTNKHAHAGSDRERRPVDFGGRMRTVCGPITTATRNDFTSVRGCRPRVRSPGNEYCGTRQNQPLSPGGCRTSYPNGT